jgi:transposase
MELTKAMKRRKTAQWTDAAFLALEIIITETPVLFLDEMSDALLRVVHRRYSCSSISRRLERGGYSRKVVYEKAKQQNAREKRNFQETLKAVLKTPEMALFIDESNKDRKAARRKWGWSKVNVAVQFRALFNMDIRYTFIGAADCFGFVSAACETIMHKHKEKEEFAPMTMERFVQYVREKMVPILGNFLRGEKHSVVILDNCSVHMDPRVAQMIEDAGAIIIYSAPYCPELIPIEFMFSKWKAYLKRYHTEFSNNWYQVHYRAILSITPQEGLNYFKKTGLIELVNNHPRSEGYGKRKIEQLVKVALIHAVSKKCRNT